MYCRENYNTPCNTCGDKSLCEKHDVLGINCIKLNDQQMNITSDIILKQYEDYYECHFHDVDRVWVMQAMGEFAMHQSMAFIKWSLENGIYLIGEDCYEMFSENINDHRCYTLEELYIKFLEDKE